jgi:hypothetical protein
MKKLRLRIDELEVDSFGISEPGLLSGTVNARSGTDMTCFGCAESETCTQNPYAINCVSYAAQCPLTENSGWTCGGSGCTEQGQYTCSPDCR